MGRKVLISFLGAGGFTFDEHRRKYRTANYQMDNQVYATPFIAAALLNHLKPDKFYFIGTMRSMWEGAYEFFCKENKTPEIEEYYSKLAKTCQTATRNTALNDQIFQQLEKIIGVESSILPIYYGITETQQWDNFKRIITLFEELEDGDEILLDITHSFRSLPIFIQASVAYLKDVLGKEVKITNVFYGMLEVTREIEEELIAEKKVELGDASEDYSYKQLQKLIDKTLILTPVVELKGVNELSEWTKAAHAFRNFGNGYLISKLLKEKSEEQRRDGIGKLIENFSELINLGYIHSINKYGKNLIQTKLHEQIEDIHIELVVKPVLESFSKNFDPNDSNGIFQIKLSNWLYKKKKYTSAYLTLIEGIITYICEQENLDSKSKDDRDFAKKFLWQRGKKFENTLEKYEHRLFGDKHTYNKIYNEVYREANNIRNTIAHSKDNRNNYLKDIEKFKNKFIPNLSKILNIEL